VFLSVFFRPVLYSLSVFTNTAIPVRFSVYRLTHRAATVFWPILHDVASGRPRPFTDSQRLFLCPIQTPNLRPCTCRTGLTSFRAEWRVALVSLAFVWARVSYLLVVLCTPSVRPSVCRPSISWLRFSRNRKAIGTSTLVKTYRWTRVSRKQIWGQKSTKGQGHFERKLQKSFFAHIFVINGSLFVKPKPKWSPAHSTISSNAFH